MGLLAAKNSGSFFNSATSVTPELLNWLFKIQVAVDRSVQYLDDANAVL